jgi:peroxiredoxin
MSFPWPPAIVSAFEKARTSEAPLGERLRIVADVVASQFPEFTEIVEAFVGRLDRAKAGESAPAIGEPMPPFILPDQDGRLIKLEELLDQGPVVVAFHRGHWCPYCQLNMTALAEVEKRTRPAQIVAVSPETQQYTRLLKEETGAEFPFLTDVGASYALSLNLAIWIDQKFSRAIAESGCDVPLYNGTHSWILPIPAVFVVRRDGIIAARHIDPDYRQRMEIDWLLSSVENVLG